MALEDDLEVHVEGVVLGLVGERGHVERDLAEGEDDQRDAVLLLQLGRHLQ